MGKGQAGRMRVCMYTMEFETLISSGRSYLIMQQNMYTYQGQNYVSEWFRVSKKSVRDFQYQSYASQITNKGVEKRSYD